MKNEDGSAMCLSESPLLQKYKACSEKGVKCLTCSQCPRGNNWVCKAEDKVVYLNYLEELRSYHRLHNPKAYKESLMFKNDLREEIL